MKNLFILTAVLVLAISCRSGQSPAPAANTAAGPEPAFGISYEKFTLDNGLEVILHEDHSDPIVAVATVMYEGSSRKKSGKTGFAHFFEHMSFNDSENVPRGANRKLIPEWGGQRNGFTTNDGTVYYEVVPKDAFDKILWIDSDRLGYMINTVTEEALAREIQVVKNEKRQGVDNAPYGFTREVISANFYPANHPYHWSVIGSLPDLQAATLEDVKDFYHTYYGAGNATLVIAGDIDKAETKEKVKRWFGEIKRGPEVKPLPHMPVTLAASKSLYFEDNFAKLPELNMVFASVEEHHPDMYALNVLGRLLSGSRKSPLYQLLVEDRKLAPSVSSFNNSRELAGQFMLRVRANAQTSLDQVKNTIDEGLLRFEQEGFEDNELKRIKAELETSLYQSVENILDKALRLGQDNEFTGEPDRIVTTAKLTQAVTREDVMRVYRQYIKDKPFVMTSFVPKGQAALAVKGATLAQVYQEEVVAGQQHEEVSQGEEATYKKTATRHDRSEPPFGEAPLFKMPAIWEAQLKNGLKLYGLENREIPLVHFEISIPGGHWMDPLDKPGVASLMARLMMQGTAHRTPAELEEAIGLLGASISISSSNEEISLNAITLARNYEPTLALVQEMLLQPRWDEAEFARLKKALETGLKGREASPPAIASLTFSRLLYGKDHILGTPAEGTLQSVANIGLDDLKSYYAQTVSPSQATFHLAGAIDQARAVKAASALEAAWPAKQVTLPTYALPEPKGTGTLYFIDVPDAKQSVIQIGKLALPSTDGNYNKLRLANEILGGGSSGRLFQTLRIEKGFTYGASSYIGVAKETAPFSASTSVRANATLPSLQILKDMLSGYAGSFTEADVAITKNKVLKRNTLAYEDLAAKLNILKNLSRFNRSKTYIEDDQRELTAMSLADFKAVIDRYLKEDQMIYIVVGDKATQLGEVKKLGLPVVELDLHGKPATL